LLLCRPIWEGRCCSPWLVSVLRVKSIRCAALLGMGPACDAVVYEACAKYALSMTCASAARADWLRGPDLEDSAVAG
jgi:hypothetical protein